MGETKMTDFNRDKAVRALVAEDLHDILSREMDDYLENILTTGFMGYGSYTDEELIHEVSMRETEGER
jgi:phosphoribulokinase